MADLCLSCGEYVGQNAEDSPYCKCDRERFKKLKEDSEKLDQHMRNYHSCGYGCQETEKVFQIVERLRKELSETKEYLDNYPQYEGSGTVEVKKRILPILQKILGEENGTN